MSPEPVIRWTLSAFDSLSPHALYALLQLRTEVFVVEQNCVFQDLDGADPFAMHLQGHADDALVAYARCCAPGVKFAEASIGRVVTRDSLRGTGIGHVLVGRAMKSVIELWGRRAIRIGAQARHARFYEGHGFSDAGVPYIEDGIDHLEMLWHPPALTTETPNTLERT